MEIVVAYMQTAFEHGQTFAYTPHGDSMLPTLQNGKDTIILAPARQCAIGDIVFYRRPNGNFVLHRLVGKLRGGYMMCGDNENAIEYPIAPSNIIAKVVDAKTADGKKIDLRAKAMVRRLWFKKLKLTIKKILCS